MLKGVQKNKWYYRNNIIYKLLLGKKHKLKHLVKDTPSRRS